MPLVKDNWYETFFSGINCEMWEKAVTAEWTEKECDFLVSELKVKQGQRILDIPCGFGRHSIELAKRGYRLTGVDISETFLESLARKIKADALSIETIKADILTLNIQGVYSGAFCLGNSFGYFNAESMKVFVGKVAGCLEKGSRFVINSSMLAESILPGVPKNKSYTLGDLTMDIENNYDANESCLTSVLRYSREGKTEEHAFKHYVYTLGEVNRILRSSGFSMVATYGSTDKKEYQVGDAQIYIVAERS